MIRPLTSTTAKLLIFPSPFFTTGNRGLADQSSSHPGRYLACEQLTQDVVPPSYQLYLSSRFSFLLCARRSCQSAAADPRPCPWSDVLSQLRPLSFVTFPISQLHTWVTWTDEKKHDTRPCLYLFWRHGPLWSNQSRNHLSNYQLLFFYYRLSASFTEYGVSQRSVASSSTVVHYDYASLPPVPTESVSFELWPPNLQALFLFIIPCRGACRSKCQTGAASPPRSTPPFRN